MYDKKIQWVLRIAVFGTFLGHGIFALQGRESWVGWIQHFTGVDAATGATILTLVGILDVLVAIIVLARPVRIVLLWAALWGFWTALVRPLTGDSIWEFVERFANWGAPLALLMMLGWPKGLREWFK